MKKHIALVLFAACSFAFQNASAQAALKIGYTDIDILLANHPKAKQVEAELTTRRTQYSNSIQTMQKELQEKGAAYEKAQASMSDVIKADKMKELQTLNERMQTMAQNADTELQQKQQQLLAPLLQDIDKAIQAAAKENNYTHVFSSSVSNQLNPILLYASPESDVTDLVLRKMGVDPEAVRKAAAAAAQQPAKPATAPKN